MLVTKRCPVILILFFIGLSCKNDDLNTKELLFWCSNNNGEIKLSTQFVNAWNASNTNHKVHVQHITEGQSSEEVILAAVVGKTTPDIYGNMWQGIVEMYAQAKALIALDTLAGFLDFIYERCDSAVIKEITSTDGHIYQVPWKVNPIITIYNKNIFASNGISELPKTYSAYTNAAAIIKNNTKSNTVQKRFGYTAVILIWYEMLFNFYPLYLAASGGGNLIKENRAVFNNNYAIGVFSFLQNLYSNDYFSKESAAASEDIFVAQTIATKWTGPWEISYLNNIPNLGFEYGYYEQIVPDNHLGEVYTYADPKNIVIFNTCEILKEHGIYENLIIKKPTCSYCRKPANYHAVKI